MGCSRMIMTRTPLRVSFIGGGSDYPEFATQNEGCVFGTTINQYVYVNLMPLPIFADEKYRFTYRVTESVQEVRHILHPVVRSVLTQMSWATPLNIATMANLPGRSGLGSSSSFTVGLIKALAELKGENMSAKLLAEFAVRTERKLLAEAGGFQDQYHASYGGLRTYSFGLNDKVKVSEQASDISFRRLLSESMVLIPVAGSRDSSIYAQQTKKSLSEPSKMKLTLEMAKLAQEISEYLESSNDSPETKIRRLAAITNEGWKIKQEISHSEVLKEVTDLIDKSLKSGAISARLCGAGGSGFLLLLSEPNRRIELLSKMVSHKAFPISITDFGSETILSESIGYSNLGVVE